jgi:hypothetical protein
MVGSICNVFNAKIADIYSCNEAITKLYLLHRKKRVTRVFLESTSSAVIFPRVSSNLPFTTGSKRFLPPDDQVSVFGIFRILNGSGDVVLKLRGNTHETHIKPTAGLRLICV